VTDAQLHLKQAYCCALLVTYVLGLLWLRKRTGKQAMPLWKFAVVGFVEGITDISSKGCWLIGLALTVVIIVLPFAAVVWGVWWLAHRFWP
jgi:hypothetical protein